ncbi:hypothetical protein DE146DRAFT_450848 [Phaeosphaeria sp. MPI-PUGE-AT-0046c]|nr:hypothetical protein DE146DRAFT_450848 [Phaeosphaeria sp. MPI-PUGE-AT-0046c]
MLSTFPHLTTKDFSQACTALRQRYLRRGLEQHDWQSVEIVQHPDATYLTITRGLPSLSPCECDELDDEVDSVEEGDDEEALHVMPDSPVHVQIHYDVILSPVYRMPVLYIRISDPLHRYPPTMTTLYEHLIPPHFRAQTDSVGILGGISVNVHPITDVPVFLIHPCQTAEVMQASIGKREMTAEEYLLIWIGALGKCVGLNVPLALMQPQT